MCQISPFRMMNTVFIGLAISLSYGTLSALLVYIHEGHHPYELFLRAYISSFKTIISLGLILGTALVVFLSQNLIPQRIEHAFTSSQLQETEYFKYRARYFSRRRSMTFASEFIVLSFILFTYCKFPLTGLAGKLMIISVCAEYGLGVYIGRKLCYAGMMLHSLLQIRVTRNLFKEHELDDINAYVNIVSTLTIIFVYIHVRNYTNGPLIYGYAMGEGAKLFLSIPIIIATPVLLIFNFYPRIVLKRIYSQSIDAEIKNLQLKLRNERISPFERMSLIIEFDKLSRDELRYRLRLTLSDLPIGITILIMILGPLLGK